MVEKALAKVLLITKDERDLIDDFLAYWGALFDPENVVVVDNGSTDPKLKVAYDRHRANGGTVIVDSRPFSQAVHFMSEHMRAQAPSCEWIFPIETDEFLFLRNVKDNIGGIRDIGGIREAVHAHLRGVPEDVGVLKYGSVWGSCIDPRDAGYVRGSYARPAIQITRFFDQNIDKLIVRASAFHWMQMWCHRAECKPGFRAVGSDLLGILHFHDVGKKRSLERALPVVEGYRFLDIKHTTPSERLRDAGLKRHVPLMCGHKLAFLDDHLRRSATLRAFRRHLGRLPATPKEMKGVSDHPDVLSNERDVESVVLDLRHKAAQSSSSFSWDELLYDEPRTDHAFEVSQVADALRTMTKNSN